MRLRSTALPIWRVTVKPNRGPCSEACGARSWPWRALASRTKARPAQRAPLRTRSHSARIFSVVPPGVALFAAFAPALAIGHPSLPAVASRGQPLAALGAPPGYHPAPSGGGHALAKPMPALAHELA